MRAIALLLLSLALSATLRGQEAGDVSRAARPSFPVPLTQGPLQVYDLPPAGPAAGRPARAVVVFLSGSGGWTYWEDRVGRRLAKQGLYVLGVDLTLYRSERTTQDSLAADLERIAEAVPEVQLAPNAPVFYAGREVGAALALAAAAVEPAPPRLAGLLLVEPPPRARYAGRFTDGIPLSLFAPRGEGTFSLAELAPILAPPVHVVDLRTGDGPTPWLDAVRGPHRRIDCPHGWRQFDAVTAALERGLDEGTAWLLAPRDG